MIVTALVAHPDDEVMCAGTLARFVDEGHDVRLVVGFFSDFGPDGQKQGLTSERLLELGQSAEAIGCQADVQPEADESEFCWNQRWVQHFDRLVGTTDLLISHRVNDHNTSHGHLGQIARTLARKNRCDLWEMDKALPGGVTDQAPTFFVRIDRKEPAYPSQEKRYPGWWDAIDARDRLYGWEIGCERAEGFTVVKGSM